MTGRSGQELASALPMVSRNGLKRLIIGHEMFGRASVPPFRMEYKSGVTVRQVRHNGEIKWQGELIYVSAVLAGEPVGLTQLGDQQWEVRYSFHRLWLLDQRLKRILPAKGWHGAQGRKV